MIGRRQSRADRALAWEIAAALLRYPDEQVHGALPQIAEAAADIRGQAAGQVALFARALAGRDLLVVQREYVETFDLDRKAALHVTYHQYGDRRQRGIVLLGLKRTLQGNGFSPSGEELPDWLPMLLEFAARAPEPAGLELLEQWRAPIELIRRRLAETGSGYAPVLDLVSASLGSLGKNVERSIERLLAEGPPEEEVGLEPFGPESDLGLMESDLADARYRDPGSNDVLMGVNR